jgi:hypothetical protein
MKQCFIIILFAVLAAGCSPTADKASPAANVDSTGTRGGGDPDAVAFIHYGNQISKWLRQDAALGKTVSELDAQAFTSVSSRLGKEMDRPSGPTVVFTDEPLRDDTGAQKMALYQREPLTIEVYRPYWKTAMTRDKYTLVALEIVGVVGIHGRYNLAQLISKNELDISETRLADQPYLTQSGAIFYFLEELHEAAPYFVMTTGIVPETSQKLTGTALYEYENARAKGYEELARGFSNLPDIYKLDVLVTSVLSYSKSSLNGNGWGYYERASEMPVSERVAAESSNYLDRAVNMLKYLIEQKNQLNPKQIKALQAMKAEAESILSHYANYIEKDGVRYKTNISPMSPFHNALAVSLRQDVQKRNCRTPSSYSVMEDVQAIRKQSEELSMDTSKRFTELSRAFCDFAENEKLDQLKSTSAQDQKIGTNTCMLFEVGYLFDATASNIRYNGETKSLLEVLETSNNGELCAH